MKKFYHVAVMMALLFLLPSGAKAAADRCYCYSDLTGVDLAKDNLGANDGNLENSCFPAGSLDCSTFQNDKNVFANKLYVKCDVAKYESATCEQKKSDWTREKATFDKQRTEAQQTYSSGGVVGKLGIPSCLTEGKLSSSCRDVSVFVLMLLNFSNYLFTIIGAVALAMFVYGGFILILSQGNPEQIKKGTGAMMAAIIGLVIAFGGYMLVKFFGTAVGVSSEFNLK